MKYLLLAFAVLSGGCAAQDYLSEQYAAAPTHTVRTARDDFGIYDKPDVGKVLVVPRAYANAGFRFNMSLAQYPKPFFQEAAEAYLQETGRRCQITDGAAILEQRWEFSYHCAA